jgi:hypothetical protein
MGLSRFRLTPLLPTWRRLLPMWQLRTSYCPRGTSCCFGSGPHRFCLRGNVVSLASGLGRPPTQGPQRMTTKRQQATWIPRQAHQQVPWEPHQVSPHPPPLTPFMRHLQCMALHPLTSTLLLGFLLGRRCVTPPVTLAMRYLLRWASYPPTAFPLRASLRRRRLIASSLDQGPCTALWGQPPFRRRHTMPLHRPCQKLLHTGLQKVHASSALRLLKLSILHGRIVDTVCVSNVQPIMLEPAVALAFPRATFCRSLHLSVFSPAHFVVGLLASTGRPIWPTPCY